jgi:hypothetical protein
MKSARWLLPIERHVRVSLRSEKWDHPTTNLARVNLALVARLTTLQVGVEDAAAVIDVLYKSSMRRSAIILSSAELKAAAL